MTDLTPLFNQCVQIVNQELGSTITSTKPPPIPYLLHDTFTKECTELYHHIIGLNGFLAEVRQPYLSINYEESGKLTIDDKNKLDEDFQIKVQAVFEKLKLLQKYENKRQSTIKPKTNWLTSYFGDEEEEMKETYFLTLGSHRAQVLRFLADSVNYTSNYLQDLQRQRRQRERQLNLLNFQNLDDQLNYESNYESKYGMDEQEVAVSQEMPELSQQQVQELETENSNYLQLKSNQLKQVENLHSSMVDIINIQSEITYHIEAQSAQIMNLIDNQDTINVEMVQGNKQLKGATSRNKKAANMIIYMCMILGFLLLFMDYVR